MKKEHGIPNYTDNYERLKKLKAENFKRVISAEGELKFNGVFIDLIRLCNFRCHGCFSHMDRDITPEKPLRERLSFYEIKDVIDFAHERGAKVVVTAGAGEPLMDMDFWDVLDYTRGKGMKTVVFTNATLVTEEVAKKLYEKDASVIVKRNTFDDERQDRLVGNIRGASQNMQRGLDNLLKVGFRAPRFALDSFMLRQNREDLEDVLRYCRDNDIIPYFESFILLNQDEAVLKDTLTQEEFDQFLSQLQKIDKEEYGIDTDIPQGIRVYGQKPCVKGYTMFSVRTNGDVAMCVQSRHILGNIKRQDLADIFDVKSNPKLREAYENPTCNECCVKTSLKIEIQSDTNMLAKFWRRLRTRQIIPEEPSILRPQP